MKIRMKFKKILPNLLLLFLSVAISLFVIEMVTRQLGREHFIQNNVYILTDYSIFSYKPNKVYTLTRPEFVNTIKVNSKGLIDYEYNYSKPNDTERIIVLGDSYIAGQEVALGKIMSKKLEKMLNKNSNNDVKYEVINMGYGGFGPTAEAILFEKEGIKYSPDILIFNIYVGNDFTKIDFGTTAYIKNEAFNDTYIKEIPTTTAKQRLNNFIFRNYFTYSYIKKLIDEFRYGKEDKLSQELVIYQKEYPKKIKENIERLEIILNHLKRYTDAENINLLVVLISTKQQVDKNKLAEMVSEYTMNESDLDIKKAQKIFLQFGFENNINMLDLLPSFEKRNRNNTFYFEIDGHWNEKGHELAANLIYEKLINEGLIT